MREGIKPSTETRLVGMTGELIGVVCFTAINNRQLEHNNSLGGHWGNYPIILDPKYVKANVFQFRDESQYYDEEFEQFVRELGIEKKIWESVAPYRTPNQIVSLKSIPVEGIGRVIFNFDNFKKHEGELLEVKPQHVEFYTFSPNYGERGITKVESA